jgi:hypothetical protein
MSRIVSRIEFARMAGVSPAAITQSCKPGKPLAAARVDDRIDADHVSAQAYLLTQGVGVSGSVSAPTSKAKGRQSGANDPTDHVQDTDSDGSGSDDGPTDSEDIEAFADMTLRQLVERFGTARKFKDWLEALKKIEGIREKRLANERTEGTLVARELIQVHVFGAIDSGNRRLLSDAPRTIATRVSGATKSNASLEEMEGIVREVISSQLKPVKATAARVLRSA